MVKISSATRFYEETSGTSVQVLDGRSVPPWQCRLPSKTGTGEGKCAMLQLTNCPGNVPFSLPAVSNNIYALTTCLLMKDD